MKRLSRFPFISCTISSLVKFTMLLPCIFSFSSSPTPVTTLRVEQPTCFSFKLEQHHDNLSRASINEYNERPFRKRCMKLNLASDRLMDDFKTNSGEVVNPYKVLSLPRDAEKSQIKKSYYKLSKKYHPDRVRHSKIMPGKCDNLDQVEEEWERIQLSYQILTNTKLRTRYERNSFIDDPSAAISRAAFDFVGWGVKSVGKGVLDGVLAAAAVASASVSEAKEKKEAENDQKNELINHKEEEEQSLDTSPTNYQNNFKGLPRRSDSSSISTLYLPQNLLPPSSSVNVIAIGDSATITSDIDSKTKLVSAIVSSLVSIASNLSILFLKLSIYMQKIVQKILIEIRME